MTRPNVDIIIPYHGNYEKVARLIGQIQTSTPNQEYRIVIVDDCSPNQNSVLDFSHFNRKITGIRLEEWSGFGAAINEGIKNSNSSHIIILHSDVQIKNINWMFELQKGLALLKSEGVKLVSARTNNPGSSANYDSRLIGDIEDIVPNIIVDKPLPFICTLCHRELFDRIGMLKEYPYAWYEDEEFFYRMKFYEFKQAIIGKSYVYHDGASTINHISETKSKLIIEENRQQCIMDIQKYIK